MKRLAILGALILLCGCAPRVPLSERGPKPRPVTPPAPEAIETSIRRGVDFLVRDQNANGSWGSATRTKGLNIYAPIPGAHHAFRAATTGLCIAALIEVGDTRPTTLAALERAEAWLIKELPRLRRATPRAVYNVWGHAYSIKALVRMHGRTKDKARQQTIRKLIELQVDYLGRFESVDGGWGYYDFRAGARKPTSRPNSFTTATPLLALKEAQGLGIAVPEKLVRRAVATIQRQRNPDFTYHYSAGFRRAPLAKINRPAGSLGRSQACNAALRVWGDEAVTDAVLKTWLDRLAARNGWLSIGRKRPRPHESWFAIAGYFYYYGHYYAGLCIELLPPAERPHFQHHLAVILLRLQEKDGSWWDYPLYDYHQPYGTAYSLSALVRCRPGGASRIRR